MRYFGDLLIHQSTLINRDNYFHLRLTCTCMKVFNEYLNLEGIDRIKQLFLENGTVEEYKKNSFFIQQGQFQKKVGFIPKGSFRYLRYTQQGKEQVVGYSFEDDFVTSYAAFQRQIPSAASAQAIKDSIVYSLTYDDLNTFFREQDFENLRAQIAEAFLSDIYGRMLSLYCDTPEQRYTQLLHRYPQIINEVNLKEIASFIKVAPETLSRIRKKISSL